MVRCKNCGLLAIADPNTGKSMAVSEEARETGFRLRMAAITAVAKVYCHVDSGAFPSGDINCSSDALAKIDAETECTSWVKWQKGKSPQEHEDMTILERVRDEQGQFQRDETARRDKWRTEDLAGARSTRIIALCSVGGTLLAAFVALIALYVSLSK